MISNALVFEKLGGFEKNVDNILEIFVNTRNLIEGYDKKLLNVISKHEEDFLTAYKTHMVKVEKQLQLLKDKA